MKKKSPLFVIAFVVLTNFYCKSQSNNDDSLVFHPKFKFSDYKANVLHTEKKPLNFSNNKDAWLFRTRIRNTYKEEGVNFAGHYCFIKWGCGAPCQESVVVDILTGKIYEGLEANLGYEYYKDSRMVVVNPPSMTNKYPTDCDWCVPYIVIWDEEKRGFIKK